MIMETQLPPTAMATPTWSARASSWGSPLQPFSGVNYNVFVAKLDANGLLQWNTFLGLGNGQAISSDANGNLYVSGYSSATWGSPLRPFSGGGWDAFVAKLDMNGTLQWNTFLGGTSYDSSQGIAIDSNGNSYVAGYSGATWGSPIRPLAGYQDAFVAKVDATGALSWNTFLGASDCDDEGWGIATDPGGNSYVIGYGYGTWGSPLRSYSMGGWDAFVAKLNNAGVLQWNTFLGGSGDDYGLGIAVDSSSRAHVTGYSRDWSWGIPVRQFVQYEDAFVAKLFSNGNLQWNTFLGGITNDFGRAIAVDTVGNTYVAGNSWGHWGSPARPYTGYSDAFASRLGPNGTLQRNIFLGSTNDDYGSGIAVDDHGSYYVSGYSLVSWGSPISPMASGYDAFVAKIREPKVDFNKDGQEDILWRYYGPGGYNRAWFLGNTAASLPLMKTNEWRVLGGSEEVPDGKSVPGMSHGARRPGGLPLAGFLKPVGKDTSNVMGEIGAANSVSAVDDPRRVGDRFSDPPMISRGSEAGEISHSA